LGGQDFAACHAMDGFQAGEVGDHNIGLGDGRTAQRRACSSGAKWRDVGAMGTSRVASHGAHFAEGNDDCLWLENASASDWARASRLRSKTERGPRQPCCVQEQLVCNYFGGSNG